MIAGNSLSRDELLLMTAVKTNMDSAGEDDAYFSLDLLAENPKENILECTELLLKFANNILINPRNDKYRRVRVANPIVQAKLLPISGTIECLFEMGFEEDGDYLTMPTSTSLHNLTAIRNKLQTLRTKYESQTKSVPKIVSASGTSTNPGAGLAATGASSAGPSSTPVPSAGPSSTPVLPAGPSSTPVPSAGIGSAPKLSTLQSEASFFARLRSGLDHVKVYEDNTLQKQALQCIPLKHLRELAVTRRKQAAQDNSSSLLPDVGDFLLLELLAWFKKEFFSWVDKPSCERCGNSNTIAVGSVSPTPTELKYGAHRIENYSCPVCSNYTRFPRYNHPGKLLETRRGRCGEWANCFTLCCRAAGFEARHVISWTDHVWTEVFSQSQNRWLHCDPCENICDKPLIYETGWGTKMTYVIAYSVDDIQDVTWRYSAKHKETLTNRTECRESWLLHTIIKLRKQRQANLPPARKTLLGNRSVVEICEFLTCKKVGEGELSGRVSGSQAWRDVRGESGSPKTIVQPSLIKPTTQEAEQRYIELGYNCARDVYMRGQGVEVRGWDQLVFAAEDIARKEELDWKMVYLARRESATTASVTWKFDLTACPVTVDSHLVIDRLEVLSIITACYEDGQVSWRACFDDQCTLLQTEKVPQTVTACSGSLTLTLTADLRRGQGQNAWQHTQLFRQSLQDTEQIPFLVKLYLRQK